VGQAAWRSNMRADRCRIDPAAILDAASESIIVTGANLDPPGPNIVYMNPAFERMTGWMADEIVGKSPRLLQGVKTDHSVFEDMRDALRRGDRWEGQAVNYRKNGAEFVMEWSITPLKDASGRTTHFVAVQRDVTARVEAERRIAKRVRQPARQIARRPTWCAISRPRWSRFLLKRIGRLAASAAKR
jgi:PAS domain S-box-containing protein